MHAHARTRDRAPPPRGATVCHRAAAKCIIYNIFISRPIPFSFPSAPCPYFDKRILSHLRFLSTTLYERMYDVRPSTSTSGTRDGTRAHAAPRTAHRLTWLMAHGTWQQWRCSCSRGPRPASRASPFRSVPVPRFPAPASEFPAPRSPLPAPRSPLCYFSLCCVSIYFMKYLLNVQSFSSCTHPLMPSS